MPFVELRIVEGRDEETVQHAIREIAKTVSETLGAPLSSVRVCVHEVPPTRWAVGTTLKSDPQD
ncbi:tautomerase family protein [Nocardioides sp. GY 10127]|uniref:tautomerase family protein n=1 Tax=Nocardioides sp. GY 10127 TaxID=2569762 RepID=UPI0010A8B373|nr:tautomerase family protein [Nocardioides sp. GY 10127]TIC81764.1 4-oxalocrotonate tautomerase [Nocardioides sp. GY 10127]